MEKNFTIKEKEVTFTYPAARKGLIFSLTVLNGTLPVVVLFSNKSSAALGSRLMMVFFLVVVEFIFFMIYFPLELSIKVEKGGKEINMKKVGPFYIKKEQKIVSSKPAVIHTNSDGVPQLRYVENKQQKFFYLYPYLENALIASIPAFNKPVSPEDEKTLAKETGLKANE